MAAAKSSYLERSEESLLRAVVSTFGIKAQLGLVQEECAELIQAVSKFLRYCSDPDSTIDYAELLKQEIADVEIMLAQLRVIFGNQGIDDHKERKLARLQALVQKIGVMSNSNPPPSVL